MKAKSFLPLLLILALLLAAAACRQEETPAAPTPTLDAGPDDEATSPPATATPPPTAEATASPTSEAEPTATALPPTPTLAPTATATPEATATPAALTITDPAAGAVVSPNSELTVAGRAPEAAETVTVALEAAGLTLAAGEADVAETAWVAALEVPHNVTGPAVLRATLNGEPAATLSVEIRRPQAAAGPAISLDSPTADTPAVAGHALFFQGRVQQPIESMVTIEVRYDECQSTAAQQEFEVGQGGQWWGFVVIPETVFGPACAIASTGEVEEPGEGPWRAAQTDINILPADHDGARGVFIGNFPNTEVAPGQTVTVYGSAYTVPERQVTVALQVDGQTVAEETATADAFGYWTADLTLPDSVTEPGGQFFAAVAYDDGQEETDSVPFLTGR